MARRGGGVLHDPALRRSRVDRGPTPSRGNRIERRRRSAVALRASQHPSPPSTTRSRSVSASPRQVPVDWVTRAADDAVRHAGEGNLVTCASGASPSGPVHLGNLREFLTVHFVADELRRRGVPVRHLHSWDDYDRFRKVPAGVDASWSEHIGRPLSAVPDPVGCHESWAEHFKAPLIEALAEMGVEMEEVSQTQMYRAGTYREQILHRRAPSRRDRRRPGPLPHQGQGPRARLGAGGRVAGGVGRRRRRRARPTPPPTTWRASRSSPTAATAGATPPPSRRTTRRAPTSPTPAPPAPSRASPT